jgi:8-oxo-dGTP pyrophosphatase MutT (NUDIX family)
LKVSQFKNKIATFKSLQLGGLKEQFKMAPALQLKYNIDDINKKKPRQAAVLALFYPNENGDMTFVLTKRAAYKGTHSSQISFPGGKIDAKDNSMQETALRETFEEIGIPLEAIEVIREMTRVYIPPSNFIATPFIGFCKRTPNFKANYEVAEIIEVLVEELFIETAVSNVKITTSYMSNLDVPCFKLNDHIVWGATAMMLSEIKELLKR